MQPLHANRGQHWVCRSRQVAHWERSTGLNPQARLGMVAHPDGRRDGARTWAGWGVFGHNTNKLSRLGHERASPAGQARDPLRLIPSRRRPPLTSRPRKEPEHRDRPKERRELMVWGADGPGAITPGRDAAAQRLFRIEVARGESPNQRAGRADWRESRAIRELALFTVQPSP